MARKPQLLNSFLGMAATVFFGTVLEREFCVTMIETMRLWANRCECRTTFRTQFRAVRRLDCHRPVDFFCGSMIACQDLIALSSLREARRG